MDHRAGKTSSVVSVVRVAIGVSSSTFALSVDNFQQRLGAQGWQLKVGLQRTSPSCGLPRSRGMGVLGPVMRCIERGAGLPDFIKFQKALNFFRPLGGFHEKSGGSHAATT